MSGGCVVVSSNPSCGSGVGEGKLCVVGGSALCQQGLGVYCPGGIPQGMVILITEVAE